MVPLSDDLDLTQAQAFALQAPDLAALLSTVDDSLSVSLQSLRQCDEAQPLHLALHDLKGYLGMVAAPELTDWVKAADQLARSGQLSEALAQLAPLLPRLQALQARLRAYRAGIIDG